jgi:hypothetical protein
VRLMLRILCVRGGVRFGAVARAVRVA